MRKKFIRPSELISWANEAQLKDRHIMGLHYNPLKDKFYLGPNVDVNYMLHTVNE